MKFLVSPFSLQQKVKVPLFFGPLFSLGVEDSLANEPFYHPTSIIERSLPLPLFSFVSYGNSANFLSRRFAWWFSSAFFLQNPPFRFASSCQGPPPVILGFIFLLFPRRHFRHLVLFPPEDTHPPLPSSKFGHSRQYPSVLACLWETFFTLLPPQSLIRSMVFFL